MNIKITNHLLSISPYISTSWSEISSLQYNPNNKTLTFHLKTNNTIHVPNLSDSHIDAIFEKHAEITEKKSSNNAGNPSPGFAFNQLGLSSLENLPSMMQHDPTQKDAPDLPKEVLDKISQFTKSLNIDLDMLNMGDSEPHCNCHYCQMVSAMQGKEKTNEAETIEEVSKDDLTFREWDIKKVGENLYNVTNPLDVEEHYQVFLGNPVGCTCGKDGCEHLLAVLNS